jgi:hypothetical protein
VISFPFAHAVQIKIFRIWEASNIMANRIVDEPSHHAQPRMTQTAMPHSKRFYVSKYGLHRNILLCGFNIRIVQTRWR